MYAVAKETTAQKNDTKATNTLNKVLAYILYNKCSFKNQTEGGDLVLLVRGLGI